MGNVYRYTHLFFYGFSFISIFLLILMDMQKQNLHISTMNKKYVWASIRYQGRYSRMCCCLDTNHFVGTPTFFRIILSVFTLCGKGKLF